MRLTPETIPTASEAGSSPSPIRAAVRTIGVWALAAGPALITLLYIFLYAVNGPHWDHLTSAEIFQRWHTGQFTLEFLFRPHNEHRKAVERLVVLALGSLTRFNNLAEMYLQWVLLCTTAVMLVAAFRRESGIGQWRRAILIFAPASALFLSVHPYDVLLVGDGLLTYLSLIFFVAALVLLAAEARSYGRLAGAIAFGVLTSFSQSNGLLVWPVGLLLLLFDVRVRPPRGDGIRRAIVWGVAGAVTIAAYFHGYHGPDNPGPGYVLHQPVKALVHFLEVNGVSLSPEMLGAMSFGFVVLILDAAIGVAVIREWRRDGTRPPFGFWLVAIALATNLMISLNRAGFGIRQGLSPRYAAYSCLAPIGLYWIALVRRDRWRFAQPLAGALGAMLIVGYLSGSLEGFRIGRTWTSEKGWQAYLLYSAKYQPNSLLLKLYPNADHARVYAGNLEQLHLNVFADPHVRPSDLTSSSVRPPYAVDTVNGQPPGPSPVIVSADDAIEIKGWALDASGTHPAAAVFLTIDGRDSYPGFEGAYRRELSAGVREWRRAWSGFSASIGGFVLAPGEHSVALTIVDADGRHGFTTPPIARVIRR